ncbi:30S ribosomal protein S6 [Acuticoccus sp. MNP-M23]|uniref:30S ribosomal protein S6 n=1 Tax=Acuticoccus sp. MNP-M23 TaxID=3072793 RepID=UPI002815377C|nr:30S ribosomal protein S6 [Acuticoccus sp. MNP-M23]WMS41272.1 30S ribosomal protein S6 [Acuticoccus sp. MNP-M23]
MALYECVFLIRQDVSSTAVDELIEQYTTVLTENGGSVGKVENWGLKTLAYRINKNRKAHFALMDIDAPAPAVQEMERQMRLNEDVLRTLTVKVDEHEDGPSVMKQKRDRDDRRRRERGERDGDGPRGDRGDRPERSDRPDRGDGPRPERREREFS